MNNEPHYTLLWGTGDFYTSETDLLTIPQDGKYLLPNGEVKEFKKGDRIDFNKIKEDLKNGEKETN